MLLFLSNRDRNVAIWAQFLAGNIGRKVRAGLIFDCSAKRSGLPGRAVMMLRELLGCCRNSTRRVSVHFPGIKTGTTPTIGTSEVLACYRSERLVLAILRVLVEEVRHFYDAKNNWARGLVFDSLDSLSPSVHWNGAGQKL